MAAAAVLAALFAVSVSAGRWWRVASVVLAAVHVEGSPAPLDTATHGRRGSGPAIVRRDRTPAVLRPVALSSAHELHQRHFELEGQTAAPESL